ncbi:hypothetical protein tinsulaeT_30890 [Thalassotalea insulae]|uniref:OmpR/PhoB-type domain-containing protein n=1 Tax=Thalassotalea insulae TaxID=2056778 RepID=A0ABQ6GX32_9GAMM|nr:winged helix-turn-helix domain-containing protein [Thalassotalea insulae]GLX79749.1 hypothetical protein tinsulaeT_30890 [Thalassotalea insulae]
MQYSQEPTHLSGYHIQVANFIVDRSLNRITNGQQVQTLEPKAIELLCFLASRANQVTSREEIRLNVWGNIQVSEHAINRLISQLRKAMDDSVQPYQIIETIARRGYRLIATVKRLESSPTSPKKQARTFSNTPHHYLMLICALLLVVTGYWAWHGTNNNKPFIAKSAVEPVSAMPDSEWMPKYAMEDQWFSYLHLDVKSNKYQLFMQQSSEGKPYKVWSSQAVISAYTWLGESNHIIIAEFENHQCILKQYQFDPASKQLLFNKLITDCGTNPVRQLSYSQLNHSLYWVFHNGRNLANSSELKLVSLAAEKTDKRQLALPQLSNIYAIAASPDGRQLALLRHFQWEYSDIYLYDIAEQKQHKIISGHSFIPSLSWARDGKQLLYVSGNQLKLTDLNSHNIPLGFSSENQIKEAYFSTTKEQLLYVSDQGRYQLSAMPLQANAQLTPISWGSSQNERNPAYANDGKQLAFISRRSGQYRIWLRNAKGESYPLSTAQLNLEQTLIRWSSDDRYLLFHSNNALYRYDLLQNKYKKLTTDDIYADVVAWSYRHPKHVYLRSDKDGQFNIWRLNSDTLAMSKITQDGGFSGHESRDGRYFYYTKEYQDGLWRIDLDTEQHSLLQADFSKENFLSWWLFDDGIYYLHGKQGAGLYWWSFAQNSHSQLWPMPSNYHGGFAISRALNHAVFALKPLGQWDIMQLKGK